MKRTAVAAPTQPPFEDMLTTIDAMDGPTLRAFLAALRERFGIPDPPVSTVSLNVSGTASSEDIQRWMETTTGWTPQTRT